MDLKSHCDRLRKTDPIIDQIITGLGYPTLFPRTPGFGALVLLILEQQVSLMSARAAWLKLLEKTGTITPETVLSLSDEELRACYLSKQKARYVRILAQAIADQDLLIDELHGLPDEEIRERLLKITGIGNWTADTYLLLVLNRLDIFPVGDIALVNSIKKLNHLPPDTSREELIRFAEKWRPLRSVAALIYWHAYIIDKKIDHGKLDY